MKAFVAGKLLISSILLGIGIGLLFASFVEMYRGQYFEMIVALSFAFLFGLYGFVVRNQE